MKFTKVVKSASYGHYYNVTIHAIQNLEKLAEIIEDVENLEDEAFFLPDKEAALKQNLDDIEKLLMKVIQVANEKTDALTKICND